MRPALGAVAEWLRSGLQSRLHRFDSGRRLELVRAKWRPGTAATWDPSYMELVAAVTLWCQFSAWLLFPHVGAPRMLRTAAAVLMWLEFLALLVWAYSAEGTPLADTARTAAAGDLPALTAAMLTVGAAYAARRRRAAARRTLRRTRS
jgi:hypothetical protein